MRKVDLQHYHIVIFALLIIVGLLRITSTYNVFWQTWDEPAHIAAGMEWLDRRQYTYELFHPPLARVMGALGPYLDGIRAIGKANMWGEGNAILHTNGAYEYNLTLARLGMLPFFIIASLVVALWANMYGGAYTALLSVVLFTTLPAILGHSGVAALDMPCAALVTAALFALYLWLYRPTLLLSHLLGITVGLAILAKFSSLGFLISSGGLVGVIYGYRFFRKLSVNEGYLRVERWIAASVIAVLVCFLVIWGGYRFSFSHLLEPKDRPHEEIDWVISTKSQLHDTAYSIVENILIPAPEFREGITKVFERDKKGQTAYLFGKIRTHGWWYFYPLVLLLKTPLPFVFLAITGSLFCFRYVIAQQGDPRLLTPTVAAIGVLVVGMLSSVNNGTRQILAIYPLLSVVAGYGAAKLLQLHQVRYIGPGLLTVLLLWQFISSFAVHPDYIAYFNELAGKHPEEIVVDSDLDWGQDLKRLATTLKKRGVKEYAISYNGSSNLDLFNLPPRQELVPYQRKDGWIAISLLRLQLGIGEPPYDQYSWLKEYQPVEKVGKSIWLYYIPEAVIY